MILAAIDIGSNAARLLITEVNQLGSEEPEFNKLNLVRVPLRLGFDVFDKGFISDQKVEMVMQTMKAYSHLLKAYNVEHVIACATSAMRDATNSQEIIKKVQAETGIKIEVISGELEASVIYENHIAEHLDIEHSYLYIDVGGGSTELTFFSDGKLVFKQSFNLGTIRILKNVADEKLWDDMRDFIKSKIKGHKQISAIGTGGNINKVFSLSKKKDGKPLTLEYIKSVHKEMSLVSLEERMRLYKLREDRADVIIPALQIYMNVMKWADTEEIYVPRIGLADGLVQHLYSEITSKQSLTH